MHLKIAVATVTLVTIFLLPNIALARITPADIVNDQKEAYTQRLSKYSPANQKKVEFFSQRIAQLNRNATTELDHIMIRQGQILDEYVKRNNIKEDGGADGINRNLDDPVANSRYWITWAHEAVAYQAAKNYIINLTGESAINSNLTSTTNALSSDLNILKNKVIKSQNILLQTLNK